MQYRFDHFYEPLPTRGVNRDYVEGHAVEILLQESNCISRRVLGDINLREDVKRPRLTSQLGYSARFPRGMWRRVEKCMLADIHRGRRFSWFMIAYADEGMRFAIDIDCSQRVLTGDEVDTMCCVTRHILQDYFQYHNERPIPVLAAFAKDKLKKGVVCCGLHIITHVRVTVEQARELTDAYAYLLQKTNKELADTVEVDNSIYKKNSVNLRPIYASKVERCRDCEGNRYLAIHCSTCNGNGFYYAKSVYQPYRHNIDDNGWQYAKHTAETVSLQTLQQYSLIAFPQETRDDFKPRGYTIPRTPGEHKRDKEQKQAFSTRWNTLSKRKKLRDVKSQRIYLLVEQHIQGMVHRGTTHWKSITVTNIRATEQRTHVFVQVEGPGSTYCINKPGLHGSNSIYFVLFKNGTVEQRCFCKKRKYPCSERGSRHKFTMPWTITMLLFPLDVPRGNGLHSAITRRRKIDLDIPL